MSLEANKAILRKVIDAINMRNLAGLDELIAPAFSYPTHQIRRLEGMKQVIEAERTSFPDWHVTLEDIIAEGDRV